MPRLGKPLGAEIAPLGLWQPSQYFRPQRRLGLCQQVFDDLAVNVGQAHVATAVAVGEAFVVDAQ
jgi:hypothetical protein